MTEKFLHYLWKMKLLRMNELITTDGEKLQIISSGDYNADAGPDFLNARIKIGNTSWAGNVEMHLKSSDWRKHAHQNDKAYDNVILHVVFEHDEEINREDSSSIPALEIKDQFEQKIFETYSALMQSATWIPCEKQIKNVSSFTIRQWLQRLMIERLEKKIDPILSSLEQNENNWEETFYQSLAQAFGAKVNAEPFQLLARSVPVKILAKHKNSLFQLEALLFGAAGFLQEKFADEYANDLKKEFNFLQKKYHLTAMKKHVWKFLRLRPANFPTVRIAQFAQLVFRSTHLLSKILETESLNHLREFFNVDVSEYWLNHYRFDHLSSSKQKSFGTDSMDLLLINTIAPFLFVYGKLHDDPHYTDRALKLLESIPSEKNQIITQWKMMGVKSASAFDSQSLLQLKNVYCKNFRCVDCAIGHKILSGK